MKIDKAEILRLDLAHVWHPLTQHRDLTEETLRVIVGGEGCTIVDADGNRYLDAMSGLWCVNVGYGRREIAEAMFEQMKELAYYPHLQANVPAALLAGYLAQLSGGELRRVYFVNSGSEACEAALKIARQFGRETRPGELRYKFISRYHSYHGTTLATLAAGGLLERKRKFEPLGNGFVHMLPPYCYRCPFGLQYPACGLACAKQLGPIIEGEGPETVAGVILEPIQSAIGVLVPPEEYLGVIAETCRKYDVLLILDEVINGFGRTGKWFCYQHYGVVPDLLCVAKGLSSGYAPIGAVMAREEIFAAFLGPVEQNKHVAQVSTWGGHAGAAAAALRNLEIMRRENLVGNAAEVGEYLLERLRRLLEFRTVGDVRGKGLLIGVELVEDKESRVPAKGERVARVIQRCREAGVLVGRSAGGDIGWGNTITIAPPLVLNREGAERIVGALSEAIEAEEKEALGS
jgi:taurine-pyruvate aminotransferase